MTIYEIMRQRLQSGQEETGVSTFLHRCEDGCGGLALRYHNTDVVTAFEGGTIRLDSGGYCQPHYAWSTTRKTQSPTTRERISRYLPVGYSLYQEKNLWWVQFPNGDVVEFIDKMVINEGAQRAYYPGEEDAAQAYQAHFRVNVLNRLKSRPR